jgi:predicted TIM-barrel fold metal-dependent hydrolase
MVIDVHVHPGFYDLICEDSQRVNERKKAMGWDLMSPIPLELVIRQMDYAGIDKYVLLAQDLTTVTGDAVISNEEIDRIVHLHPDRFVGFASVDPHRNDAIEVLEKAFRDMGMQGLKLHPSKQQFYPADPKVYPIYEKCIEYNKPVIFHAGMSWEPNTLLKYANPVNFEEVAIEFPDLRLCLAHFGFPWVLETASLILKYENVYADTSMLYMDSPDDFFDQIFTKIMGISWVDNNLNNKVLFGSNSPRFRPRRIKQGLDSLSLRPKTKAKILGENAMKFLNL